jgi:hypothetical protein
MNTRSSNITTSYGYLAYIPTPQNLLPFDLVHVSDRYDQWQLKLISLGLAVRPLVCLSSLLSNLCSYGMDSEYDYKEDATIIKCQLLSAIYLSSIN